VLQDKSHKLQVSWQDVLLAHPHGPGYCDTISCSIVQPQCVATACRKNDIPLAVHWSECEALAQQVVELAELCQPSLLNPGGTLELIRVLRQVPAQPVQRNGSHLLLSARSNRAMLLMCRSCACCIGTAQHCCLKCPSSMLCPGPRQASCPEQQLPFCDCS